ncbi:MAG: bifunctional folylpolyglutamate synthase/dihydrofolate synthase [Nitrospiria bacterium]
MTTYTETIEHLYQMQRRGIRPGLARITSLLAHFDHPERSFKAIHISGTNGKGSTAAMVASVLREAGYRVGLYTSPHLLDFSERIQINHDPIPHDEIVRLTERLRRKLAQNSPRLSERISFFEFTTGLAFLYFAEQGIDYAVVEVGLGGQFDATNVVDPLVSSITSIDLDHECYLGSTLTEIAAEKAGIIKEDVPVVLAASQPEVISIIAETARLKKAPLVSVGKEVSATLSSPQGALPLIDPMKIHYTGLREYFIELPLLGRHQIENAATAIGIIESLQTQGLEITENNIVEGLRKIRLSGRLEVVQQNPLILLDGAHNPAGARMLGAFLSEIDPERDGTHWLITGIMQDKQIAEMLRPLLPWADSVIATQPDMERAAPPEEILGIATSITARQGKSKPRVTVEGRVTEAVAHVLSRMKPEDTLVITGSFYTIGEAKGTLLGTHPSPTRG